MTTPTELAFYFKLASDLSNARRSGVARSVDLAVDELEVFAMYAESPKLVARAQAALAEVGA